MGRKREKGVSGAVEKDLPVLPLAERDGRAEDDAAEQRHGQNRALGQHARHVLDPAGYEFHVRPGGSLKLTLTLSGLAAAVRRHLGPGDPLHGYADLLDSPDLAGQPLRGYLTGSIDSVLRVRDGAGERFLVL